MKRLVQLAIATMVLTLGSASTLSAQRLSLGGRVVGSAEEPIAYATVVLIQEATQVTGTTTNSEGRFSLSAVAGDYTLNITYIGYKTYHPHAEYHA